MNKSMALLLALLAVAGSAAAATNDAALDTSFSGDGLLVVPVDVEGTPLTDMADALAGLDYPLPWIVGTATSNSASGRDLTVARFDRANGATGLPKRVYPGFTSIAAADASDYGLLTLGTRLIDGVPHAAVHAIDFADVVRQQFGTAGVATLPGGPATMTPLAIAAARDGLYTHVMTAEGSSGTVTRRLTLLGASGQVLDSIALDPVHQFPYPADMLRLRSGNIAFALVDKRASGCLVRTFALRPPTPTTRFPVAGVLLTFESSTATDCQVLRVHLAEDDEGRLYVCIRTSAGYQILRRLQDGGVDTQFGVKTFTTALTDYFVFRDFAVQSDGKMLLGGYVAAPGSSQAVLRLTASGQRDATFGNNGLARVYFPGVNNATAQDGQLEQIVVDAQDRILGVGWSSYQGADTDFAVFRMMGSSNVFRDSFE